MPDDILYPPLNPTASPQAVGDMVRALRGGVEGAGRVAGGVAGGLVDWAKGPGNYIQALMRPPDVLDQVSEADDFWREKAATGAQNWGAGTALGLTGGGVLSGGLPGSQGTLGIFGAPSARVIAQAEKMGAKGIGRDDIWNRLGVYQEPTGNWFNETFDKPAQVYSTLNGPERLPNVMTHPDLYRSVPDLRKVTADLQLTGGDPRGGHGFGMIRAQAPNIQGLKGVTLHEVQHAVNDIRGFPDEQIGSMWRDFVPKHEDEGGLSGQALYDAAHGDYLRHGPEVQARNVTTRMDMTPEELRARPPYTTVDVPYDQQIWKLPLRRY